MSRLTYVSRKSTVQGKQAPTVIVMHGYGADELDLLPIINHLGIELNVISLQAPYALPFGGYAWYHLEQTVNGLHADDTSRQQSESLLLEELPAILKSESLSSENVYLMGFSQGAAMSYSLLGAHDLSTVGIAVQGVVALSGYIPRDVIPKFKNKKFEGFPLFISHGEYDELIPSIALDEAKVLLEEQGANVTAKVYPVGHGLTEETVSDLSNWLEVTLQRPVTKS